MAVFYAQKNIILQSHYPSRTKDEKKKNTSDTKSLYKNLVIVSSIKSILQTNIRLNNPDYFQIQSKEFNKTENIELLELSELPLYVSVCQLL